MTKIGYLKLLQTYPRKIGFGAIHYLYSSFGQTFFLSIFVPYFISDFSLDSSEFSKIYSVSTLLGALGLYLLGHLADKMDIRTYSISVGLVLSLFSMLLSFATSWSLLLVALVGIRLSAQSLMPLLGATAISRYFVTNRGKALSISSSAMSVAELSFPYLTLVIIGVIGWQTTWLYFAIFILFSFIPLSYFSAGKEVEFRHAPVVSHSPYQKVVSRLSLIKDCKFLSLVIAIILNPFITAGVFIHQYLLTSLKGWTEEWFAISLMVFGLARIISTFFTGHLIDIFSAKRLIYFIQIPTILGFLALLILDSKWALIIFTFGNGIALSSGSLIGSALWVELYGSSKVASIKSLVSTLMVFSTAISPLVFNHVFQESNFNWCLIHFLLFSVIISILSFWAVRK